MIDIKTIRDWVIILIVLLIVPNANRIVLVDLKPDDWYGELRIPLPDRVLIVAKNSSNKKVQWGLEPLSQAIALQGGSNHGVLLEDTKHALPKSLSVVTAKRKGEQMQNRNLWFDGDRYFKPGKLSILTQSDLYNSYLVGAILLGGFMALGFMIGRVGME